MSELENSAIASTPEGVAYQLLLLVMQHEGRFATKEGSTGRVSRVLMLDAYADCLEAVKGKRERRAAQQPRI